MQILNWKDLDQKGQAAALARPRAEDDASLQARVAEIIESVRKGGDAALRRWRAEFEGPLNDDLRVSQSDLERLATQADSKVAKAMAAAKANITAFHAKQLPSGYSVETLAGVACELRWLPLDSVGIYVPGGTAPLVSSLLMQAIPAKLAGVKRVVVATPAPVSPAIAAAALLCGVDEVYAMGGAQAIAALAFGTNSIARVAKITGPGNRYVTVAKRQVSQSPSGPAIEMPAGPSEVMVIADASANPRFVAADLLSQAEHGPDSQVMLICDSRQVADAVLAEVKELTKLLSRAETVEQALKASRALIVADIRQGVEIANRYAPEHLILQTQIDEAILAQVSNAGSVFVGAFTPESAGDYASGTNHVLPTAGAARAYSGLKVTDFMRSMSVQRISEAALALLAPTIQALADAEGLDAHRMAVDLRLRGAP